MHERNTLIVTRYLFSSTFLGIAAFLLCDCNWTMITALLPAILPLYIFCFDSKYYHHYDCVFASIIADDARVSGLALYAL